MGEAKQRQDEILAERLKRELAEQGKLIEVGFAVLCATAIPSDAPEVQVREMRMAYMAGAQHLFSSILSILDPGGEPTEADLHKMDLINAELRAFHDEVMG